MSLATGRFPVALGVGKTVRRGKERCAASAAAEKVGPAVVLGRLCSSEVDRFSADGISHVHGEPLRCNDLFSTCRFSSTNWKNLANVRARDIEPHPASLPARTGASEDAVRPKETRAPRSPYSGRSRSMQS